MIGANDTIVALATAAGSAARAILRSSGPRAFEFAEALSPSQNASPSPGTPGEGGGEGLPSTANEDPHPNRLPAYREKGLTLGGGIVVSGSVLTFKAPRSSTGEDVVEYHVPGSPWIVAQLLARLLELGARQSEPGEFTSRAFFNGKLDLSAAEGVVATIAASNRAGLDAARQLLAGELSRRLRPMIDGITHALALVEIGIDFSEEDVTFIAHERLVAEIQSVRAELEQLLAASPRLERLSHEPRIVLAGRPNAGKSSLLNALAGHDRAVIADVAGTTRDALSVRVPLDGGWVTLVDVAGLEQDAAEQESTSIDAQMRAAAEREIETADCLVRVHAADDDQSPIDLPRPADLTVRSKSDLAGRLLNGLTASVRSPDGLEPLRIALNETVFAAGASEIASGSVALNVRHRLAISEAIEALDHASAIVDSGAELVATELRSALAALGRVLGHVAPDDVLGKIFSGFCIGK